MASPQKENGFTPIANELFEAIYKLKINRDSLRIVLFITRKTYGWRKKRDRISLSQFVEELGIDRTNACRHIKKLSAMKIIIRIQDDNGNEYEINKNYEEWEVVVKQLVAKRPLELVAKRPIGVVVKQPHTKETITKERKESRQSRFPKTLSAFRDIRRVESGRPPMEKRVRTPEETEAFEELRESDTGFGFYKRRAMEEHGLDFSAVEEGDNSRLRKQQRSVKAKLTPRGETIEQFYEWILTGGHPFAKKVMYDPTVCISDILLNAFINRTVKAKETNEDIAKRLLDEARKRRHQNSDESDYRMWARGDMAKELNMTDNDFFESEEYKKVKHIIGD
ncbi:MAG: replication protein [Candidatus Moranbacteria bacterium]|nr:replication protein [Candidatus Moranbacteria bacterium]